MAEPYLSSYPIASQIVGTAIPLIDRMVETEDISPSSTTTALVPERIHGERQIRAFLILPLSELKKSDYSYNRHSSECSDMYGLLCSPQQQAGGAPASLLYQRDRVRDVVYLTVSFHRYDNVFDPLVLLREAQSDCSRITASSVQQARDYLSSNEDLFVPEDVDVARRTYRHAELLLRMRELGSKGSLGELLDLLDQLGPRSYFISPLREGDHRNSKDILSAHEEAVRLCIESAKNTPIIASVVKAWRLTPEAHYSDRWMACPKLAETNVLRLDLLGTVMSELAVLGGRTYDVSRADDWQGTSGATIKLLHGEANALYREQSGDGFQGTCKTEEEARQAAKRVSLFCPTCWEALLKQCTGSKVAASRVLAEARAKRRELVRILLDEWRPDPAVCQEPPPDPKPGPQASEDSQDH
ncbi:hypothetical protein BE21_56015 [Sorangium cellulosum]|uniref:Uncharacterized protein n=1 Tax=Sorangium cellulosum TaxID=56 RepID=A0A150TAU1_SORCE|nr:hypothetical protein BE21_56015 [Sorangium cellulosum]